MDNTNMTILTWNDAGVIAKKGTVALLVIKEYERYDLSDLGQDVLVHYPVRQPSYIGIADGKGNWDTAEVSPEMDFLTGGPTCPNEYCEVIKWAKLPFAATEDLGENVPEEKIDSVLEKIDHVPFVEDTDIKVIH